MGKVFKSWPTFEYFVSGLGGNSKKETGLFLARPLLSSKFSTNVRENQIEKKKSNIQHVILVNE